ncbi:hypothetical protein BROOK1789C_1343 [Bathymodiolus brooksi thiotrophic gill symbiont]|nr:hypothetical protein BROOK1789B_1801 [Bathymodiolus brooksi thiotrophic gill symbiont]CAB9543985.1 hypothetical protein BROOK1789C_1343 [Bathymodiolus brooksi thiotrophic gill symbiont]
MFNLLFLFHFILMGYPFSDNYNINLSISCPIYQNAQI